MNKDYIKQVVDETLEMFPGHCVNDVNKDLIIEHFSKIEFGNPENPCRRSDDSSGGYRQDDDSGGRKYMR